MDGSVVFGWRCHIVVSFVPVFPMGLNTVTKKRRSRRRNDTLHNQQMHLGTLLKQPVSVDTKIAIIA